MKPRIVLAGEKATAFADSPSLLSLHNPEFLCARDGRDALAMVSRYRPQLAILEEELPLLSGADAACLIRADGDLRRTSIILLGTTSASTTAPRFANIVLDISGGLDVEALAECADRLLSVAPRVKARASICVGRPSPTGSRGAFAQSLDLSVSGMLVGCREQLSIGEQVSLHFVLPQHMELIRARGRVVRTARVRTSHLAGVPVEAAYGVEFTTLLPQDQLRIRRFIDEVIPAA